MSDAASPPRCFLCGARLWGATRRSLCYPSGRLRRFARECLSCGLLADPGAEACANPLESLLTGATFRLSEAEPFGLTIFTLRCAALRWGLAASPADAAQAEALLAPHGTLAAAAHLAPLASLPARPVALGLLCRESEVDSVVAAAEAHRSWAAGITVLADGAERPTRMVLHWYANRCAVQLAFRPLGGDFAEQRNALQDRSTAPWMLQLDADERLDAQTGAAMGRLAAFAEAGGAVSVGFSRRNLVDGVLSDLFPDTQYRLNRCTVRFAGRVHERPERPWTRSLLALGFGIDHNLSGDHVRRRSQAYEALSPGDGRLFETERLLLPFRA